MIFLAQSQCSVTAAVWNINSKRQVLISVPQNGSCRLFLAKENHTGKKYLRLDCDREGVFLFLTIPITFSTCGTTNWRWSKSGRLGKSEPTKKAKMTVAWQRQPTIFRFACCSLAKLNGHIAWETHHFNWALQRGNRWLAALFFTQSTEATVYHNGWRHISPNCHGLLLLSWYSFLGKLDSTTLKRSWQVSHILKLL